jgi:hypothetical protein
MKRIIKADERTRKLAEEAYSAQNACNACGLAHRFAAVLKELLIDHELGTDTVNQHPVTRLWIDKFQSLARIPQDFDASGKTYFEIRQLMAGVDVEIDVVG